MMERRRDVRVPACITAHTLSRGGNESVDVLDVSRRGISLRMPEPPPMMQLTRLRLDLPGGPIEVHAFPVRLAQDITARGQRVGLQFFALNGEDKTRWERFIFSLLARAKAA